LTKTPPSEPERSEKGPSTIVPEEIRTVPEATASLLTNLQEPNLDPALLNPEISKYFLITHPDDPPPYTETDGPSQTQPSQQISVSDIEPTWPSQFDPELQTFIARPLMDLSSGSTIVGTESFGMYPAVAENRSISISPAMLDKSAPPKREDVVWYSSGKEMQVGGRRPPRTNSRGKGKGNVSKNTTQKSCAEQRPLGTRHEMNVETGLDTVKRIKLVFHDELPTSNHLESGPLNDLEQILIAQTDSIDEVPEVLPLTQEPDMSQRDARITPPAVIESGRPLLSADEMHLDDNTPPRTPVSRAPVPKLKRKVEIVILDKEFDKFLYPLFLGMDARQTMVTNKASGKVKGIIYNWQ